ncbi:acyl-CoA-like ligand-binding transcription factor [Streptosporangium soli]
MVKVQSLGLRREAAGGDDAAPGTRGPFTNDLPPELRRKRDLIVSTPALREYSRKLWIASEGALAEAVAAESGRDPSDMTVRALARYVLEIPELAGTEPDPLAALNAIFDLLASGWPESPKEA